MGNKRKLIILSTISLIAIALFLFYGMNVHNYEFLLKHRIPNLMALILVAITIGYSTLVFQTVTHNRILTPSIMGLDTLYVFMQTFLIFIFGSTSVLIVNQKINYFLAASLMIGASFILYTFVLKKARNNILFLLLIGSVLSTFFRSFSSFMQMIIDPNEFNILQNTLFASFNKVNTDLLVISIIIVLFVVPFIIDDFAKLDICNLGRDQAINLGIDYDRMLKKMLIVVAILISVSTALVGPVTFLGIIVVNLAREMFKTYKHTTLFWGTALISIIFLVLGQFIVDKMLNFSTPLSVIINFIGGLYFIILLLKESRI